MGFKKNRNCFCLLPTPPSRIKACDVVGAIFVTDKNYNNVLINRSFSNLKI